MNTLVGDVFTSAPQVYAKNQRTGDRNTQYFQKEEIKKNDTIYKGTSLKKRQVGSEDRGLFLLESEIGKKGTSYTYSREYIRTPYDGSGQIDIDSRERREHRISSVQRQ